MVDNFSIALSHGLLLLAAWRLIHRPDLDMEDPPEPDAESSGFVKNAQSGNSSDA
jgi:hypothetical protein